jgi:signal transduction histidine kinase
MPPKPPAEPTIQVKMSPKATSPGHDAKSLSARLLRLLTEQLSVAQSLEAISRGQSEAVLTSQPEVVDALLDQRAELISTMRSAAEEIAAIAQTLTGKAPSLAARGSSRAEFIAAVSPELREPLSVCVTQLDAVLTQVQQRDAADVRTLAAHRDDIARELATVSTTNRAAAAYGAPPATPGTVYQDRQA